MFIRFDGVGMTYAAASGPVEALADISFGVEHGQLVALVGPNGCGKSTLFASSPVSAPRRAAASRWTAPSCAVRSPPSGMVFQTSVLLRWRRVIDNVLLPADLAGRARRDHLPRARELLAMTVLADFAENLPGELSGGMQQRASLCRALLLDPPLLLMDEPFGALDAMTRDEMNLELLRVWGDEALAELRKTILFVTHSIPEAVFLADRVVVMTPRPGRVAQIFDVPMPRPRTVTARASVEFGRLCLASYEALHARGPAPLS